MELLSVNVAFPKVVAANRRHVETGIFKLPADGPVKVGELNLEGDKQADLSVHGGFDKAVYAYSWKNTEHWKRFLQRADLHPGSFGENLTVDELLDTEVSIGDELEIGTARFLVTQPRLPCYKLGIKFGRVDIIKRFLQSRRTGFYFAVMKEGEVKAGDEIEMLSRDENKITISDITRLYAFEKDDLETMLRAVKLGALSESWREYFVNRLQKLPP